MYFLMNFKVCFVILRMRGIILCRTVFLCCLSNRPDLESYCRIFSPIEVQSFTKSVFLDAYYFQCL